MAVTTQDIINAVPEVSVNGTLDDPNRFVSNTGVVLRVKPVPPLLIVDAQRRLKEPLPPKVHIVDKDTYEENPNDPAFLREYEEYRRAVGELANAILLTRGTVLESVPHGFDKPEDTQWAEEVHDLTGLEIPAGGHRRYYCWLRYVVVADMNEFSALLNKIANATGVTREAEVQQAAASFRDTTQGDADSGVRTPEAS